MSILGNSVLGGSSGQEYIIERSLRLNDGDAAYLRKSDYGTPDSTKIFTFSAWIKRGQLGDWFPIAGSHSGTSAFTVFGLDSSDRLIWRVRNSSVQDLTRLESTARLRDVSAWYHVLLQRDSTDSTAADRAKLYINGVRVTDFDTENTDELDRTYSSDFLTDINVGRVQISSSNIKYADGYIAEYYYIDGTALDPSSFTETDSTTGQLVPKKYTGSFGTNGFYLNFADNSAATAAAIGKDLSGNSNNFTPNNISVTAGSGNDSLADSPTNNWCTINTLDGPTSTTLLYSEGNLTSESTSNSARNLVNGTFGVTSGKWYWELTVDNANGRAIVGVALADANRHDYVGKDDKGWGIYQLTGNKYHNGVGTSYGSAWTTAGDVVQIALDADNSKIWFGINGTFVAGGDPVAGTNAAYTNVTGGALFPSVGDGSSGGDYKATYNFGQRAFAYTPPTNFKSLNAANLPGGTVKKGSEYFNTIVWSGDGSTPRSITGVGFQPDLIWTKPRSTADDHLLMDVIRGTGNQKWLSTNSVSAEGIAYNNANVTSLDSDGFTVGTTGGTNQLNATSRAPVAWNWKAGGSGSANTNGSISSTVSVNADAGFSIVEYTGNSTAGATVGHGLGVAPKVIITKSSSTNIGNWGVYHYGVDATSPEDYMLNLNLGNARTNSNLWWNDTAPTSTVFTVGTSNDVNGSSDYIAYCFAEVEGYSKFGSYEGNGSSDGTFIALPFKPAFFLLKDVDRSNTRWIIMDNVRDPHNVAYHVLSPSGAQAEDDSESYWLADFVSNGVKLRYGADNEFNKSGDTYIYMAFAETPFKYANAR